MNLKIWATKHKDEATRKKLVDAAGTSMKYFEQLLYTSRQAGPLVCESFYEASKKVTPKSIIFPEDIRPDLARIFNKKNSAPLPPEQDEAA